MANKDGQCRQSCSMKHTCIASKVVKSIHFLCMKALYFCPFLHKNAGWLSFLLMSFPGIDQRAMWISACDFIQSFLRCRRKWMTFLCRGIARDMGTWGLRGLLGCCIAWSWQLQQGTGGNLKRLTLCECSGRNLAACVSCCSKGSLLPLAPGSFAVGWVVPCYPLSALTVPTRAHPLLSQPAYPCSPCLDVRGVSCCSNLSPSFQTW